MASEPTAEQQDQFFRPIGEQVAEDGREAAVSRIETDGDGDDEPQPQQMVSEIESMCMNCHANGSTRLLLTYIPYFREVIISSFTCPQCHFRNSEIQSAGEIQPKGCVYTVHITNAEDLNRQVVKSEHATVSIPEIQLTIPSKRGQLTTIEGVLSDTLRDLAMDQPLRKHMQPETFPKIEALCDRLREVLGESKDDDDNGGGDGRADAESTEADSNNTALRSYGPVSGISGTQDKDDARIFAPLTFKLEDPTGNSFIEFLGAIEGRGMSDAKWSKRDVARTKEQNEALGLKSASGSGAGGEAAEATDKDKRGGGAGHKGGATASEDAREMKRSRGQDGAPVAMASKETALAEALGGGFNKEAGETERENEEIFSFQGNCGTCNAALTTLMKRVSIPYFKDILIMSTNCDQCGYRDNEVKSGSAIPPKGKRLTLRVEDGEDLSRDILKSESAGLSVPEIDLHLAPGTLGGRFTTLEGLLQQVYDELSERVLMRGDSSVQRNNFEGFLGKLKAAMSAEACPYTVILDDPLADSYIQNPYAPDVDEQVKVEEYERTHDQNEDLGLIDIKVDDYSEEAKQWRLDAEARAGGTGAMDTPMGGTN